LFTVRHLRPLQFWTLPCVLILSAFLLTGSVAAKKADHKPVQKNSAKDEHTNPSDSQVAITRIRHWSSSDVTHVAVDLEGNVKFDIGHLDATERLFLDMHGAQLSAKVRSYKMTTPDGFVSNIRVGDGEGSPRVALDLNTPVEYAATLIPDPYRLEITLHRLSAKTGGLTGINPTRSVAEPVMTGQVGEGAVHDTNPPSQDQAPSTSTPDNPLTSRAEPQPDGNGDRSLIRALGLKISRIVIDPGHGGDDTGGIGPSGLDEKDVVLDVATRLGRLLEGLGATVTFTRVTDIYLPLEARTGIANREQGDLFISIHANTNPDHSARGIETYYLNFTSSPDALEVAARENTVAQKSVSQLRDLVQKIALQDKVQESRELASVVQSSISKNLPESRNRGVKEAPFIVLTGANMPAILTEISFLSNPDDEANLKEPEYRQKIALTLYQGISDYIGKLGGVQLPVRAAASTGVSLTPIPPGPPPAPVSVTRSDVLLGFIAGNRPFLVTALLLMAAWSFFLLAPNHSSAARKSHFLGRAVTAEAGTGSGAAKLAGITSSEQTYSARRKLRVVRRS